MKKHKIKYDIQENFLEEPMFDKFQELLFSYPFSWFWQDHKTYDDRGFFSHTFYQHYQPNSPHFEYFIVPIIRKLRCGMIGEVRANCLLKDQKHHFSKFHCDQGV